MNLTEALHLSRFVLDHFPALIVSYEMLAGALAAGVPADAALRALQAALISVPIEALSDEEREALASDAFIGGMAAAAIEKIVAGDRGAALNAIARAVETLRRQLERARRLSGALDADV